MQMLIIAGNVGKDAVLRRTNNGDAVLSFNVAVDNGKDKSGNRRDSTWVRCSIWGKRAESLEDFIKKGAKLTLTGRPGVDVYEGNASLTLSVQELTFMGGGSQERNDDRQQYDGTASTDIGDEIPF
jgi:single-strand DNA-binding protein